MKYNIKRSLLNDKKKVRLPRIEEKNGNKGDIFRPYSVTETNK